MSEHSDPPPFELTWGDVSTLLALAECVDDKSPAEKVLVAKLQAYLANPDGTEA